MHYSGLPRLQLLNIQCVFSKNGGEKIQGFLVEDSATKVKENCAMFSWNRNRLICPSVIFEYSLSTC